MALIKYYYFTKFMIISGSLFDQIFPCDTCNRSYKNRETLWRHKRYECGKEPQFKCTACPYRGKRKDSLKSHWINKHENKIV